MSCGRQLRLVIKKTANKDDECETALLMKRKKTIGARLLAAIGIPALLLIVGILAWKETNVRVQRETAMQPSESSAIHKEETILHMGGRQYGEFDNIFMLERNSSQWKTLPWKLPHINSFGGSAYLNGELYIFGGDTLRNRTYKFDRHKMEWIKIAEMNERRSLIGSSSVVFQGCIWVFGGNNDLPWSKQSKIHALSTVEKFCPETNKWIQMPKMNIAKGEVAAAVHKGNIVVSGGDQIEFWNEISETGIYREETYDLMKVVESFNPTTGIWSPLPSLAKPRSGHSMVSLGDRLIIMGGVTHYVGILDTVVSLDPNEENATWKTLPSMKARRKTHSTVIMNGEIIIIGGHSPYTDSKLNSSEIFDGNTWRLGPEIPDGRHGSSAVVVPLPFP